MNSINLIGRLTKDPEQRHTTNGKAVANFTLAVDRPFSKNETDFINVVAWNKTAEIVTQYTGKGSQIGVTGRLQVRNYENNDGKRVYVTEVVADTVKLLDKKGEGQQNNSPYQPAQQENEPFEVTDDILPF